MDKPKNQNETVQAQYGISVKEALSLNVVNQLKLIGGQDGVDRIVKFINVIEMPDISKWIMDGELLLTTGYSFREYPDLMRGLIPIIAEKGGAGLAIKLKRFIDEVPPEIIEDANYYNVPVLEIPYDLSFAEVISPILEVISNKQNTLLKQLEFAHKELIELVLQGSTLKELCDRTSNIINSPVVITSAYYDEFILSSDIASEDQEYLKDFLSNKEGDKVNLQHKKMKFGNIKEIEYAYVSEDNKTDIPLHQAIRIPIIVNQQNYGYIYAIYSYNFIDEFDILVLERAATVAGLEFMKRKAVFEIEKNYRNEFLDLLLSGECKDYDQNEIVQRGKDNYNIDLSKNVTVALINIEEQEEKKGNQSGSSIDCLNNYSHQEKLVRKINELGKQMETGNFLCGIKGNNLVILIEVDSNEVKQDIRKKTRFIKEQILKTSYVEESGLIVGVGNNYEDLGDIHKSYNEAYRAIKICQLTKKPNILHFEDLGFFKILYEKPKDELKKFAEDFIRPLVEYDQKNNGELIETLEVYYNMNRNLKKTSKKMFTHYNTVLYRIEKIENLTGLKLNNPENSLNLEIAINIYKLLQE